MGIKKKARPINRAKNLFIKWLKSNNAESIDIFEGEYSHEWDYYKDISGFIGDSLYSVCFTMWNGKVKIRYSDEENSYDNMQVDEFLEIIS